MSTYLLIYNNEIRFQDRGKSRLELEKIIQGNQWEASLCKIICIEDEVEKYHLWEKKNEIFSDNVECNYILLWYKAYLNNNINGFSLPIEVNNNFEYKEKLKQKLNEYINCLDCPAFIYEEGLWNFVNNECEMILMALDLLLEKKIEKADEKIMQILDEFIEDSFLISDLDKSYSFRGASVFENLQDNKKEENDSMCHENLTFFRARIKGKNEETVISTKEQMLHLPYDMREKASGARFNDKNIPALYLGVCSYVCSEECRWNKKDELYVSTFIPNSKGKKLKILNLTISQNFINGIYKRSIFHNNKIEEKIQYSALKIFPLVIATSFRIKEKEDIRYEYLLSQAVMRVAEKKGIDGIAYWSMRGEDEFQYPQGINLAIFANDICKNKQYSERCNGFEVSKPIKFSGQCEYREKSYINKFFTKKDICGPEYGKGPYWAVIKIDGEEYYEESVYGEFDNYIVTEFLKSKNAGMQ